MHSSQYVKCELMLCWPSAEVLIDMCFTTSFPQPQFITGFRLGKQPWKGKTTVSFVAYFVEQLRLYDELTHHQGPPLSDSFKRAMLDNAVQGIEDLRQVRITQSTLCQQLNQKATFNDYLDLLTNAATVYDDHQQNGATRPGGNDTSRRVYSTLLTEQDQFIDYHHDYSADDTYYAEDDGFDIDAPLATVTAFAAQQRRAPRSSDPPDPSTRLPDSLFARLTVDDKRNWARLSADARRLILSSSGTHHDSAPQGAVGGLSSVNRRVLMTTQHLSPWKMTQKIHY